MMPCPCCGEPIADHDAKLMRLRLSKPDPLEPLYHRLARSFYFSSDDPKTTPFNHGRGKFRTHTL